VYLLDDIDLTGLKPIIFDVLDVFWVCRSTLWSVGVLGRPYDVIKTSIFGTNFAEKLLQIQNKDCFSNVFLNVKN